MHAYGCMHKIGRTCHGRFWYPQKNALLFNNTFQYYLRYLRDSVEILSTNIKDMCANKWKVYVMNESSEQIFTRGLVKGLP